MTIRLFIIIVIFFHDHDILAMMIRLLTIIIGCRNPTNLPRAVWDSDPEAAIVSYLSTLDLCLRFYHLLFVSLLLSFTICVSTFIIFYLSTLYLRILFYHLLLFNFMFVISVTCSIISILFIQNNIQYPSILDRWEAVKNYYGFFFVLALTTFRLHSEYIPTSF